MESGVPEQGLQLTVGRMDFEAAVGVEEHSPTWVSALSNGDIAFVEVT